MTDLSQAFDIHGRAFDRMGWHPSMDGSSSTLGNSRWTSVERGAYDTLMDAARRWDWLTIPCTNCDGDKWHPDRIGRAGDWRTDPCPVCGGRGWTINPEATELVRVAIDKAYDEGRGDGDQIVEAGLTVLVETAGDNQ